VQQLDRTKGAAKKAPNETAIGSPLAPARHRGQRENDPDHPVFVGDAEDGFRNVAAACDLSEDGDPFFLPDLFRACAPQKVGKVLFGPGGVEINGRRNPQHTQREDLAFWVSPRLATEKAKRLLRARAAIEHQ
jgi:hypothetical protein